jgi:hypothetical protein
MTRDFSVAKMIIFPSVPLPSFTSSDPTDMHAQLETRDKNVRLGKTGNNPCYCGFHDIFLK